MKDCQLCAACCRNALDPKWIEVTESDASAIDPDLLQSGDVEKFAMKQDPSGACLALKRGDPGMWYCSIYDKRPSICRAVEKGGTICRVMRSVHGFED